MRIKNRKNQKVFVKLKKKEKDSLRKIVKKGKAPARIIMRANILLLMNKGLSSNQSGELLGVTPEMARATAVKYNQGGISMIMKEAPRPGKMRALTKRQETQIIAMVCSSPPKGTARWTVRLIAEEAKKRKIASAKRETMRLLLKSHDLKPWREKNVVHSRNNSRISGENV